MRKKHIAIVQKWTVEKTGQPAFTVHSNNEKLNELRWNDKTQVQLKELHLAAIPEGLDGETTLILGEPYYEARCESFDVLVLSDDYPRPLRQTPVEAN